MEFSTDKQIYKIGDIIYPTDFSSFNDGLEFIRSEFDDRYRKVKGSINSGKGLEVCSLPYMNESLPWFGITDNYYVLVRMPGDDKVYSIFNNDRHITDYKKYREYVLDVDECRTLGY